MLRYAESLVEPLGLQLALESKAERGYRLALGQESAPHKWTHPGLNGARPDQALGRLAAAAFEQIARNAAGVMRSDDPEYLHQMRVGLRRLRALFRAFRALQPKTGAIRRRLRGFSRVLSEARDWDVVAPSRPEARNARAAARVLVASAGFNEALVRILRWIEEAPWRESRQPLAEFAAIALDRLQRKALKEIDWSDRSERHALRIRLKRLRYAADALAECFPGAAGRTYLGRLEALQESLGALNDIAVARRLLKQAPDAAAREKRLIGRAQRDWNAIAAGAPFWRPGR
jgi:triphosphatase